MTKTIKENTFEEYVSMAMDGEDLSDEMLDSLLADDEAAQKWYEYHLISDCMKQQSVGRDADFMQSSLFKATLAEISREHQSRHVAESFKKTEQSKAANHVFKGFAVAASLAAVAVSIWQFWPQSGENDMSVATQKVRPADGNIVSVTAAAAENKTASEPVVPNAVKELPQAQTAVRIENKAASQQQEVVH